MRSTRVLTSLAAVALALVLLLVWIRWTREEGAAVPAPIEPAGTPEATLQAPGSDVQAADASSTRAADVARRDALEVAAAPAPTCLVRVVEAGNGKPLPDARLWIQREDVDRDGPEWWRAMRRFNDVEPVLAGGLGLEVALDGRGTARVPQPVRTLTVAAARGSLHGTAAIEPRAETCTVELKPYHALTIEVVGRDGKPVPGALVVFFWGEFDPLEDSNVLPVDEHGRLVLAKLENHIFEHSDRGPVRVTVAGGVPCQPEKVEFTLDSVPTEPVRFVAGDFGSVEVQLIDRQGRELALEGTAYLDIITYWMEEPTLTLFAGAGLDLPLEGGRALFAAIGLDLPLEVGCAASGHGQEWREVTALSSPGQKLRVLLPIGERRPIARGRVLDAAAPGALTARAPALGLTFQARIEGEGAFERPLGSGDLALLAVPWFLKLERRGEPARGATVVPRVDAEQKVVDFGEVALEPLSELARVRVVDDAGQPVASAAVNVRSESGFERRWSDEHGNCLLEGPADSLPWQARAAHDDWLASDWLEIVAPGTEATLALRRGAALEGRLLLPRGANLEWCELELAITPSALVPESPEVDASPVEGGRFRFAPCEPGLARLVVRVDEQLVLERTGIELVAGATTQLPDLDLRTVVRPFTLTLELASGEPWLGGHLEVLAEDGETSTSHRIGPSARVFLVAPRLTLDLWVAGRDARPTRFEGVVDGDHLVLPSAPSIVLRLPRGTPPPLPPLVLVVRGQRTTPEEVAFETDSESDDGVATVGADGIVRLSVPWPGEYELFWSVRQPDTGVLFDLDTAELQTVAIDDSTAGTVIEAHLPRAALAQAVVAAEGR